MTNSSSSSHSMMFRIGWFLLLSVSVLAVINHATLAITMKGEEVLFIGWAALNLYAIAVIYFTFRPAEKWGWFTTWIMPLSFALTTFFVPEFAQIYGGAAAIMVIGLLMTYPTFFQNKG